MMSAQRARSLKKSFCRHGEKLSGIRGAVGIEKGRNSSLLGRRSILRVIFIVELVSKLMQDNVLAIGGICSARPDCVPRQHEGVQPTTGLTQAGHFPLLPHMTVKVPSLLSRVGRRIDQDGEQTREVVGLAMQQ